MGNHLRGKPDLAHQHQRRALGLLTLRIWFLSIRHNHRVLQQVLQSLTQDGPEQQQWEQSEGAEESAVTDSCLGENGLVGREQDEKSLVSSDFVECGLIHPAWTPARCGYCAVLTESS